MDSKGIELTGLNLAAPAAVAKSIKKESSPVRPVTRMEKAELMPRHLKDEQAHETGTKTISQEEAQEAAEILQEYLAENPNLEARWNFDEERGILVVEIRDKKTGEILRQIPPEEILSGRVLERYGKSGNLIDEIA